MKGQFLLIRLYKLTLSFHAKVNSSIIDDSRCGLAQFWFYVP